MDWAVTSQEGNKDNRDAPTHHVYAQDCASPSVNPQNPIITLISQTRKLRLSDALSSHLFASGAQGVTKPRGCSESAQLGGPMGQEPKKVRGRKAQSVSLCGHVGV